MIKVKSFIGDGPDILLEISDYTRPKTDELDIDVCLNLQEAKELRQSLDNHIRECEAWYEGAAKAIDEVNARPNLDDDLDF